MSNQKGRKRDVKMKIEKYKEYSENNYEGLDYPVKSDYTVGFAHNKIFIRTLDKTNYLVITLEPQDIRNLMKWQMGQDEYHGNQRKQEYRENLNIRNQIIDKLEYLRRIIQNSDKNNPRDIQPLKSIEDEIDSLEDVIIHATGRDIKDL